MVSAASGSAAAAEPTAVVFSGTENAVVVPVKAGGSFTSVTVTLTR